MIASMSNPRNTGAGYAPIATMKMAVATLNTAASDRTKIIPFRERELLGSTMRSRYTTEMLRYQGLRTRQPGIWRLVVADASVPDRTCKDKADGPR